jgi:hypothetical protein
MRAAIQALISDSNQPTERAPMAEYGIQPSPAGMVRFLCQDKKASEVRVAEYTTERLLLLLADRVPNRRTEFPDSIRLGMLFK